MVRTESTELHSVGRHLFTAGFSASLASGITAPLDVVRIVRMTTISATGAMEIVQKTFRTQGLGGFWIGYSSEAVRQWTYGVARIGLHRIFSTKLSEIKQRELKSHELLACAGAAGLISVPLQIPFDKIKIRQIKDQWYHGDPRYRNVFHGLSSFRGCPDFGPDFRKIFPAAMARTVVTNVAGIGTFDILKRCLAPKLESKVSATTSTLIMSALSSFCVILCMAPLDSIRNRIIANPSKYTGLLAAIGMVIREEGPLAVYRGASVTAGANWIHNFVILNVFEIAGRFWDRT